MEAQRPCLLILIDQRLIELFSKKLLAVFNAVKVVIKAIERSALSGIFVLSPPGSRERDGRRSTKTLAF